MYSNYCGQHHQQHPVRAPGSWLLTRGKFTSHLVSIHGGDDPGPGEPRQRRAAGPGQRASPRVGSGRSIEGSKRPGDRAPPGPKRNTWYRGVEGGPSQGAPGMACRAAVCGVWPATDGRRAAADARGAAPRADPACSARRVWSVEERGDLHKSEGMQGGNGINTHRDRD
jgi:hypothetical protein